jgi:hypothetical protein
MRIRIAAALLVLGVLGLVLWQAELFTVADPGAGAQPLRVASKPDRREFDVSLPVVPVGISRITPGEVPLLVHYWAPWERNSRAQILALDSLASTLPEGAVRIVVVTFDPFPSVARFVGRARVRSTVLLDLRRDLQRALPCPSIPYTWLIAADGSVRVAQPGEVDWLAPATRDLLLDLAHDPPADSTTGLTSERQKQTPAARATGV